MFQNNEPYQIIVVHIFLGVCSVAILDFYSQDTIKKN